MIPDTLPTLPPPSGQALPVEPKDTTKDDMAALRGGETAAAVFLDGRTEQVFLHCLPVRKFQQFVAAIDDECALIELVADKPKGWADALTLECHEALVVRAFDLNFSGAARWFARSVKVIAEMSGGVNLSVKISPNSAPASPSSSAAG